ncbi:cellulose binding domain-containing protein [Actinoallomurus spadix]|nr:cellulose binding domain-containing protein [Actinoallomurus spadix]MCO5989566.1 cellulose binding domain-containing protein [Actinoallomurus spadix]
MRPRRAISYLLALLLSVCGAGLVTGTGTGTAHAAVACDVTYAKNDWGSGFSATITLKNLGDALSGWTLSYAYTGEQKLTQGWSGTWSQSGKTITVTSASWNGALASGATAQIGANFTYTGTNTDPTSFSLNGTVCNGSGGGGGGGGGEGGGGGGTTGPAPALHVSGNRLVTASGATVRLRGANRSGGEFMCVQGRGIWDGPVDDASIDAMVAWKIKAVRIPLNEECWLGLSNIDARYGGTAYQTEVKAFVSRLEAHGVTPIVEMHWNHGTYTGPSSGCSDVHATCQKPMPDAQYAPSFWTGVANAFKGDDAVVLDLFNEPYPERATGSEASGWTCWRDGGTCAGIPYQVAGFQSLVNAVRATGATNVILVGGLAYSNDLTQWLQYRPADPKNNLAAFAHIYNFNTCANTSCYDGQLAPVAAQVPLTLSEIGENDCSHDFIDTLMSWADTHAVGYLGWTWNTWDCGSGPSLISSYDGTPTSYGIGLRDHLVATG